MTSINFSLLFAISFFGINLLISTYSRKHLTYKGIQFIMILNNLILFIFCISLWTFFIVKYGQEYTSFKLNSNNWSNINYEISFKINSLSFLFIMLVNVIGFATNIYILNYFKYEERSEEFILLINWFILSMIILVIGNNFFTIIIGWELIGLTSFLLINFWKFKSTTLSCSFKAFAFNKISDIFLMISFCLLWNTYKINNIDSLLTALSINNANPNVIYYSALCLMISSGIKSAQILGHLWLPDSMEAPVPASSLIHSATLVSAGIYLILKFQSIFIISDLTSTLFFIGSFTACYGGIIAASQSDMKKLLAYSTISHCGFIFASIALNNFIITIIYLYLHGLFKAMTFFCAGSIIKSNGTQDTRLMGMNKNQLVNTITLIVASANLGGLPFTFGYLYKSLFLNFMILNPINVVSFGLSVVGLICGIIYVFKIIYYSCFDFRKGFIQTIYLLLQNNLEFYKKHIFSFTFVKYVAFFILYIFSMTFFFINKCYLLNSYIFFFYQPNALISDYNFLTDLMITGSFWVVIYYSLFIATFMTLLFMNWRTNYFFIEKLELFTYIFAICIFFYFFGNVTSRIVNLLYYLPLLLDIFI